MKVFDPAVLARSRVGGGGPMRLIRRLVVLAFAVVQAVLVGRILLDLGILPADGAMAEIGLPLSDALAAPVEGLGDGLAGLLGGGVLPGFGSTAGDGLNATMIAALAGWTIIEGLVLRVVSKFAAV